MRVGRGFGGSGVASSWTRWMRVTPSVRRTPSGSRRTPPSRRMMRRIWATMRGRGRAAGAARRAREAAESLGEEAAVRVPEDSPLAPDDAADLGDDAGAEKVGGVSPTRRGCGDEGELDDGGVGGAVAGGGR